MEPAAFCRDGVIRPGSCPSSRHVNLAELSEKDNQDFHTPLRRFERGDPLTIVRRHRAARNSLMRVIGKNLVWVALCFFRY